MGNRDRAGRGVGRSRARGAWHRGRGGSNARCALNVLEYDNTDEGKNGDENKARHRLA